MHDDTRIEDYVDGPHQEPGHQRHQQRLSPQSPTTNAVPPGQDHHDHYNQRGEEKARGLGGDRRPTCRPEPQERAPISLAPPSHHRPRDEHGRQSERQVDAVEVAQPEHQGVAQPEQRGEDSGPDTEEQVRQGVERQREHPAFHQRYQAGGERDAVERARPYLCLDEPSAVGALIVDVPVSVRGYHRVDREDRKGGQHLEERWVLGVVGEIVVENGSQARGHVHGLVERGGVVPGLETTQDHEDDGRHEDQHQSDRPRSRAVRLQRGMDVSLRCLGQRSCVIWHVVPGWTGVITL